MNHPSGQEEQTTRTGRAGLAPAPRPKSAIDRLQSAAHELVLDRESYRQRQKPTITRRS